MTKNLVAIVIAAGLAGALVLQYRVLRDLRSEVAALKTAGAGPAESSVRPTGGVVRAVDRSETSADASRTEQRLAAIEDAVQRLTLATELLMERGQLPLSESKAAELRRRFLDSALPDNQRIQALRALRRDGKVDDAVLAGGLAWIQSTASADTAREVLDQFDGLNNALLREPLLMFAANHEDPRLRRQAVENLEHFVGDPAVDAFLWKTIAGAEDPALRRQAENSLRNAPMTEARVADLRRRAMNGSSPLDERLAAFRTLGGARDGAGGDISDLALNLAGTAQASQDPAQRARIFAAFDGMNNPALAPALVNALQDPDPVVRRAAADSLSDLRGLQGVSDWLQHVAANDADPAVRDEAQQALQPRGRRGN